MEKANLRERFREEVLKLSPEERQSQSKQIFEQVASFLKDKAGETWSLYSPLSDEPDLLRFISQKSSVRWVFPKVQPSRTLLFYHVTSFDQMEANSWGLVQPDPNKSQIVDLKKINGFIIPALAYDKSGVRLGRGGGYYDQTLKNYAGHKVGVIFEKNFSEHPLPKEDHDQSVDCVVTSKLWIQVKGQSWI